MDIALAWTDERRIALFRIDGPQVLQPAAERIAAAIEAAADAGAKGLVVDFKDVEGIDPPDLAMRQIVVRRWAEAARSRLHLAMVVREDFIDPERFAVVAAANFGLVGNVFENQADALEWLRSVLPPPG